MKPPKLTELSLDDYRAVLNYYQIPIPKSERITKKKAEAILAGKLCRCIKSVSVKEYKRLNKSFTLKYGKIANIDPKIEEKSIGICSAAVLGYKGLKRGTFTCKKKEKIDKLYKLKNRIIPYNSKTRRKMKRRQKV